MNPKRIIIVGTMALTITVGGGLWTKEKSAHIPLSSLESMIDDRNEQTTVKNDFLKVLGASSDEEIYYSLLDGNSLADIAEENHGSVTDIIHLQIAELSQQLDLRLANGSLDPIIYNMQKAEVADIIKKSVYGEKNT